MSDELKSAWEIALEKLEQQEDMEVKKLTEEQKQAIAELRQKYQARIAEAEIGTESRIRKVIESGAYEEIEKIQGQLVEEKKRLNAEVERKIQSIRNSVPGSE